MPVTVDPLTADLLRELPDRPGLAVGIDTITLAEVAEAWHGFGERYARRLFTPAERDYALQDPASTVERLAARFAAKEAAIKALNLGETGIGWRDIEVCRRPDGSPTLLLHGRAQQALHRGTPRDVALSLSHDRQQACAVVVAWPRCCTPITPSAPT